jgi:hypothetical protein
LSRPGGSMFGMGQGINLTTGQKSEGCVTHAKT